MVIFSQSDFGWKLICARLRKKGAFCALLVMEWKITFPHRKNIAVSGKAYFILFYFKKRRMLEDTSGDDGLTAQVNESLEKPGKHKNEIYIDIDIDMLFFLPCGSFVTVPPDISEAIGFGTLR